MYLSSLGRHSCDKLSPQFLYTVSDQNCTYERKENTSPTFSWLHVYGYELNRDRKSDGSIFQVSTHPDWSVPLRYSVGLLLKTNLDNWTNGEEWTDVGQNVPRITWDYCSLSLRQYSGNVVQLNIHVSPLYWPTSGLAISGRSTR